MSWGAAKNSGGLPLNYLVEKYTVASDSWAKQAVTANTELKVNDLEEGKEYEFRVFSENEVGESEPLSTARPIVAKNQYSKLIFTVSAVTFQLSIIKLKFQNFSQFIFRSIFQKIKRHCPGSVVVAR